MRIYDSHMLRIKEPLDDDFLVFNTPPFRKFHGKMAEWPKARPC